MRLLLLLFAVSHLSAQTVSRAPRGPAAQPEAFAWARHAAQAKATLASLVQAPAESLPPAPEGVTDLGFADFFGPIGDRGLDYSEKLRALAGRRVRLVGYMVREVGRAAGRFRLTPWAVVVESTDLCVVDDTPPTTAYVVENSTGIAPPPWRPGRLVLIGTIELGPMAEPDGRNSFVRLLLDQPTAASAP